MYAVRLLGCEGDGNAGVGSGGGVVEVSAYMGDSRVSGVLSSAGGVLEMSVVRCVGGVCDMCMCLARSGLGGIGGERNMGKVGYVSVMLWVVLEGSGWAV